MIRKKTHQKNRKASRQKQLDFFSKHSVFAARKEFVGITTQIPSEMPEAALQE